MSRYKLAFLFILLILAKPVFGQPADAELIQFKSLYKIDKGKLNETIDYLIQINNQNGLDYADFSIGHQKTDKLILERAWIEDQEGKVMRTLKDRDMEEVSAVENSTLYQDFFNEKFSLRNNVFPYRINIEYTLTKNQFISLCDWDPVYDGDIPTHQAELIIEIPSGFRVNIYEENINQADRRSENGIEIYRWNANYEKLLKDETYAPSPDYFLPRVIVVPQQFNYGIEGSFRDWASFGEWQTRLMQGLDVLPLTEQTEIQKITLPLTSTAEKAKAIYHYLEDHMRYINVTMDIGGWKPYPASYVAQNKYGDCKALSNYMLSALTRAGIKSFYTEIYESRTPSHFLPEFPSQQFNHALIAVPMDNDTLWLENTDANNPFGYLGVFTQGRYALLINGEESHLVRTPALKPGQVMNERKITLKWNAEHEAMLDIEYKFRGWNFEYFNSVNSDLDKQKQDEYVKRSLGLNNLEIQDWNINKENRDSTWILLTVKAINRNIALTAGPYQVITPFEIKFPDLEPPSKRELPVLIPYPLYQKDTQVIEIPIDRKVQSTPPDTVFESLYGKYFRKITIIPGRLTLEKQVLIFPGSYPLKEYPAFYSFLESIRKEELKKILIK